MIKSSSNKITKESFNIDKGNPKIKQLNQKLKEEKPSPRLNRVTSAKTTNNFYTNKEKPSAYVKSKLETQKNKEVTKIKKQFETEYQPIRIKTLKSTRESADEKIPLSPPMKTYNTKKKIEVNKKNATEKTYISNHRSYGSLNERILSPIISRKNEKLEIQNKPTIKTIDKNNFSTRENNLLRQYKINDVKTIVEVKESFDKDAKDLLKGNEENQNKGVKKQVKKMFTAKNILNLTTRNKNSPSPSPKNFMTNMKTNKTTTNIFSRLYYTANEKPKKNKPLNLKNSVEKTQKVVYPKSKINKKLMSYNFSNPDMKFKKPRPLSEVGKMPRNLNKKEPTKPLKTKLDKKANFYSRPKSTFKKYETEFRINETSLSTQASYLFRGIVEDYAIGKELGKGAYAVVKQALHKPTNKKFAVKVYEKSKLFDPQKSNSVKKEIQILKKIDHPNIVKMHEVLETSKQIMLVMDLVNGVSLLSFLKSKENRRLDILECKDVCYQITQAIAHLHGRNIVHRDIKLENILIDENKRVKIIDFGFGCITANRKLDFFCGTPSYMPPEIVQKIDYIGEYADIWSLGILFYTLLCGAFPFRAQTEKELYAKIIRGHFMFPDHVPNSACILIRKILHLTPALRPSAEDIMNDAWFNTVRMADISKVYQSLELATSKTVPILLSDSLG